MSVFDDVAKAVKEIYLGSAKGSNAFKSVRQSVMKGEWKSPSIDYLVNELERQSDKNKAYSISKDVAEEINNKLYEFEIMISTDEIVAKMNNFLDSYIDSKNLYESTKMTFIQFLKENA